MVPLRGLFIHQQVHVKTVGRFSRARHALSAIRFRPPSAGEAPRVPNPCPLPHERGLLHLIRSLPLVGTTFSPAGAAEKAFAGRFMGRPDLQNLDVSWGHEPGRKLMFSPSRSVTAKHSDAPARVARWVDWFRLATYVLIGEPWLPAGEICSSWIPGRARWRGQNPN
jgi:hypothetical protein